MNLHDSQKPIQITVTPEIISQLGYQDWSDDNNKPPHNNAVAFLRKSVGLDCSKKNDEEVIPTQADRDALDKAIWTFKYDGAGFVGATKIIAQHVADQLKWLKGKNNLLHKELLEAHGRGYGDDAFIQSQAEIIKNRDDQIARLALVVVDLEKISKDLLYKMYFSTPGYYKSYIDTLIKKIDDIISSVGRVKSDK